MNTELFTGKAVNYAAARPSYPETAIDYIMSLAPQGAVFADIGAGTGKFTELLARRGNKIYAVEPNGDMNEQLTLTLAHYKNAVICPGTAEETNLPDNSADVITCAQALHWFDPAAFRAECQRISKPGALVIVVYNITRPGGKADNHREKATAAFFTNPTIQSFPNPITYDRETWRQFMTTHSHSPLPTDPNYTAHMAGVDEVFERENVNGLMRIEATTVVYSQ